MSSREPHAANPFGYVRCMTATSAVEHLVPAEELKLVAGTYRPRGSLIEARSLCGQHQDEWFPPEGAVLCGRCARYAGVEKEVPHVEEASRV